MKVIKHVCLIGLGAVGAAFASIFYEKDPNSLQIIVDEERRARYEHDGIHINGQRYDFQYVVPSEAAQPADLILIAVKGVQLQEAITSMRPFVGPETILLSLLNGITSEMDLAETFGSEKVLHGFCVATDAIREHTSIRFRNHGKIVFGDHFNPRSEKVQAVKILFDETGIPYQIPQDILRELWWKFMMNVGINQVSAILRAPYGVFSRVEEARELLFMASREVLPLAWKEGVNLTEKDIEGFIPIFERLSPESKTSMLQDVEAGRKTEVESFSATVMALGRKHGIPTPVNDILFRMIRSLEKTYPTAGKG